MKRYLVGFVAGVLVGGAVSVFAARIVGADGHLSGWEVHVDGEEVCSDPYIWTSTREIECD
jgi:hypothetical protein